MPPLVSIVTLNWNQAEVTCDLLASLTRVTYPRMEVIVVDNGSEPADLAMLAAYSPRPRLLRSRENLGFTGGNNLGMRHARGEYVLLLNNDTEVEPDFLEPLVAAMEADPGIGAASPKIRYYHTPERIQYAGGTAVDPLRAQARWIGSGEIDEGQHDVSGETEMGHGAALLIRRAVLEDIGMLGEDFFIYYEEIDFGTRLRRAGWNAHYVAESTVWHKESVTVGKASPLKTRFQTRNRLLYLRRNARGWRKPVAMALVLLASLVHAMRYAASGQWEHVRAVRVGLAWHLTHRRLTPDARLAPRPARLIDRPIVDRPAVPRALPVTSLVQAR
ncbi:MAG: glycosyltransferase family 2 protein [Bacteroidota bacterium]